MQHQQMQRNPQGLRSIDFLGWNPQLFREVKGKLNSRNTIITGALSLVTQFIVVILFLGKLPEDDISHTPYGRYGMSQVYNEFGSGIFYTKDAAGRWLINWPLWWLDLFLALSLVAIFTLLVLGTYLLVADLIKEKERGTLNFIRLAPQSSASILLGKLLGVPILLYVGILSMLPLHTWAALQADIPLHLVCAFDGVVLVSCAFFYCLALLWSLVDLGLPGLQPWLASGSLGLFLLIVTSIFSGHHLDFDHTLAWLYLFHPALALVYLIDATAIASSNIDFVSLDSLASLAFYEQAWWQQASVGIGLITAHFALWTYWCWQVLQRRFHNPQGTLLRKVHSYWLSAWVAVIGLGFALQDQGSRFLTKGHAGFNKYQINHLTDNFTALQFCLSAFGILLILALSPSRQALIDWSRSRHQQRQSLWRDLILRDSSPATVAIFINLAIALLFISPSIWLIFPANNSLVIWGGFLLSATNIVLCSLLVQLVRFARIRRPQLWSLVMLGSFTLLPLIGLSITGHDPATAPQIWLFSFMPTVALDYAQMPMIGWAILGQWLGVTLMGMQLTRKLHQAGTSETKQLVDGNLIDRPATKYR